MLMQVQSLRPLKGNSLHKNTPYDVQIVKIIPPIVCTADNFTQPQNPKLYNGFQTAKHSLKSTYPWGICTPI